MNATFRSPDHQPLDLGLIGNCRVAALVNPLGRIVWWCAPRFDGDPVFCNLLSGDQEKGFCEVALEGMVESSSGYRRNTAVIETVLRDGDGNALRISDFAPRFKQFGRHFRPATIVRRIEPLSGLPRIRLRVRPTHDYGKPCHPIAGSNHIRFVGSSTDPLRLRRNSGRSMAAAEMTTLPRRAASADSERLSLSTSSTAGASPDHSWNETSRRVARKAGHTSSCGASPSATR